MHSFAVNFGAAEHTIGDTRLHTEPSKLIILQEHPNIVELNHMCLKCQLRFPFPSLHYLSSVPCNPWLVSTCFLFLAVLFLFKTILYLYALFPQDISYSLSMLSYCERKRFWGSYSSLELNGSGFPFQLE